MSKKKNPSSLCCVVAGLVKAPLKRSRSTADGADEDSQDQLQEQLLESGGPEEEQRTDNTSLLRLLEDGEKVREQASTCTADWTVRQYEGRLRKTRLGEIYVKSILCYACGSSVNISNVRIDLLSAKNRNQTKHSKVKTPLCHVFFLLIRLIFKVSSLKEEFKILMHSTIKSMVVLLKNKLRTAPFSIWGCKHFALAVGFRSSTCTAVPGSRVWTPARACCSSERSTSTSSTVTP